MVWGPSDLNLQLEVNMDLSLNTGVVGGKGSKSLGVQFDKLSKKWRARILLNGKRVHLGLYDTVEEAIRVYQAAKETKDSNILGFLNPSEDED